MATRRYVVDYACELCGRDGKTYLTTFSASDTGPRVGGTHQNHCLACRKQTAHVHTLCTEVDDFPLFKEHAKLMAEKAAKEALVTDYTKPLKDGIPLADKTMDFRVYVVSVRAMLRSKLTAKGADAIKVEEFFDPITQRYIIQATATISVGGGRSERHRVQEWVSATYAYPV